MFLNNLILEFFFLNFRIFFLILEVFILSDVCDVQACAKLKMYGISTSGRS